MKLVKRYLTIVALICSVALPSSAQFRVGLRAGLAVNKLHFNENTLTSHNRNGFTGGVTTEFTVPVIGLGFDASVLYARRSVDLIDNNAKTVDNRDYINIPINLKYKIALPVVSRIITPFITTGPDFSFLLSGKNIKNGVVNKKFDTAWTVGAGVELLRHLQVAATYGIGLKNSVSGDAAMYSSKNRCWTVTASYYF